MAGITFEDFINFKRFSNYSSVVPLFIYFPFGLLLGILRLFIFTHALLLFYFLPSKFPFKRVILRVMLTVTGLPISVQGVPKVDSKKLIVSNSISNLDPFILALFCPNKVVLEDPVVKPRNKFLDYYSVPADVNHDEVVLKLKEHMRDAKEPLLFFPERLKTNGKASLLKFSNLPFEMDSAIQPVTIQTTRFLFNVSVSTLLSGTVEDIFWCLVLPFTLFTIKYLPVTVKKEGESRNEFSSRVQNNMAKSMGINTSDCSHHDVTEYSKCRTLRENEAMITNTSNVTLTASVTPASLPSESDENNTECVDEEIDRMLKQVKDVFPDYHPQGIIKDLEKTRDVDITITNILEGKLDSVAITEPSHPPQIPPQTNLSFKAEKFGSNATNRHLSFTERKQAMLEAARMKYKMKHSLL